MRPTTIAICFDNSIRPETTGGYCLAALREFASVHHVLPSDIGSLKGKQFDLYLRIDDGLEHQWPADCRPSAWWAIDTHLDFERCLAQARVADLTFAAQRDGAEALRRAGIENATWLPLACDPGVHRRHDEPKQFDVAFVGNLFSGPRRDLIELIARRYRKTFVGNRYFEEMARTYSASRIVFNRSIRNDVNMRVFEGLACGSLLMTNDLSENGQAELFRDGVHLATYFTGDDLLDKLDFYLRRPKTCTRIGDAGRREVMGKHTYRHRMETILASVEKLPLSVPASLPSSVPASQTHPKQEASKSSGFDPGYFEFERPELLERVPASAQSILEVGCAAGRLGATLKARQPCRVTGLEFDPAAAAAARARLDEVFVGDAESLVLSFADASFDVAICGDVLEHMREPLAFLRRVRRWLKPDGRLVASIPNVRHHTVIRSLLSGNWTYEPAGLLDQTHLRFFTRREIEKLLYRAGFDIESMAMVPGPGPEIDDWVKRGRPGEVKIGRLHIGGLERQEAEEFHAYQYLPVARPAQRSDFGLTSIIILTHNQLAYTRRCLDSIRLVTDVPYELILVDNGSSDGTLQYLRSLAANDPSIKVIANPDNQGFPRGCNQGIAIASGSQILLLNNDTVVTTGWLDRLLRALYSDANVGLAGPCTDNASGEQQVPANFDGIEELDGFAWDWAQSHLGQRAQTDRLVGFCLLIRRQLIDQIGVLDEQFGIGCFEDDDYCRRAAAAGFRAVIAWDSFIHHVGGATFRDSAVDFAELMRVNERRYRDKWDRPRATDSAESRSPFVIKPAPGGGLLLDLASTKTNNRSKVNRSTNNGSLEPITPDVCLCMIARDNAKTIVACLSSIRPWVDKMIVVDTGSVDETPRLCRELGAEVHHFRWCDDFSAARNESLRYSQARWNFWMDTDDTIDEANGRGLQKLVHGPHDPKVLGYVVQVHFPGADSSEDDLTVVDHVKLFRNRPDLRFDGRVHEQILGAISAADGTVGWTDLFVLHSGYDRSPEGQERKKQRDFRCLHLELAERPNHTFTLFNLGMTHADIGEHVQAIDWLRKSIAHAQPQETHLRKAYSLLVASLAQVGRSDEAMRECDIGLQRFPMDTELRFRRGLLLHQMKRYAESVQAYQDVLARAEERHFTSVDPALRGFKTRQNLAVVFEDMNDLVRAEEQWRRVIAEAPNYLAGWRGLGQLLLKARKARELEQLLSEMAENARLASERAVLAAQLTLRQGRLQEARRGMEEALARFPANANLRRDWARMLFEHFGALEAEPYLWDILKLDPNDASAWHNLGTIRMIQKRPAEAARAFEDSLRHRPDSPATQMSVGEAYWSVGKVDAAVRAWHQVLNLAPGHQGALDALQRVNGR